MSQEDKTLREVMDRLAVLAPSPEDAPRSAQRALAELRPQLENEAPGRWRLFWKQFFNQGGRRWATAVAVFVLILAASLTSPTVRAAASDFLGLFRVQKFAAISISPQQLAVLDRVAQEGVMPGKIEIISEPAATKALDSLAAAADELGVASVKSPALLGRPDEIYVMDGGRARMIIDLAGSRQILESAEIDPGLLPENLEGAQVDVTVYPGIEQDWENGMWLVQMASPLVVYPPDLDHILLGEALLQLLGMTPEEAGRLAREIDWTSTVLLPIPRDIATFSEVSIGGNSGMALSSLEGGNGALIWQEGGVLYVLSGPVDGNELLRVANSME